MDMIRILKCRGKRRLADVPEAEFLSSAIDHYITAHREWLNRPSRDVDAGAPVRVPDSEEALIAASLTIATDMIVAWCDRHDRLRANAITVEPLRAFANSVSYSDFFVQVVKQQNAPFAMQFLS